MKRTFLFFFSTLSLFSCSNQVAENKDSYFTREDFQSQKLLSNPEKVVFEDTYNDPVCYWLIQDSLVLVQNQPQSDYMIEIFSLNTQKAFWLWLHGATGRASSGVANALSLPLSRRSFILKMRSNPKCTR